MAKNKVPKITKVAEPKSRRSIKGDDEEVKVPRKSKKPEETKKGRKKMSEAERKIRQAQSREKYKENRATRASWWIESNDPGMAASSHGKRIYEFIPTKNEIIDFVKYYSELQKYGGWIDDGMTNKNTGKQKWRGGYRGNYIREVDSTLLIIKGLKLDLEDRAHIRDEFEKAIEADVFNYDSSVPGSLANAYKSVRERFQRISRIISYFVGVKSITNYKS